MGSVGLGYSSDAPACGQRMSNQPDNQTQQPDRWPDATKYEVIREYTRGPFSALMCRYKGCTNYGGLKVLVVGGYEVGKPLDPHFHQSKGVNDDRPVVYARFIPEEKGWVDACAMVDKRLTEHLEHQALFMTAKVARFC